MTFADTSRSQLFYLEETVWGQTPASALKTARFTGETLGLSIENTQSNEIRSDRQITYASIAGFTPSSIEMKDDFSVSNLDVEGFLDSAYIIRRRAAEAQLFIS